MHTLIHFSALVAAFALMPIIPGIRLRRFGSAIACALVFVLLNFFLRRALEVVLVIGTLGLAFIALNFFTNLVLLWLTDKVLESLEIKGFFPLLLATLLVTAANAFGTYQGQIYRL